MIIIFSGCVDTIDDFYTNQDAIVEILEKDQEAILANDPDFVSPDTLTFYPALEGLFHPRSSAVKLDSSSSSYQVELGDTVSVNGLVAREATAKASYQLFYTLTLISLDSQVVEKHLSTTTSQTYKDNYFLKLGSDSRVFRGWLFWGTSPKFNLVRPVPNITWNSEEKGDLPSNEDIIFLTEYMEFTPRDRITVTYQGQPDAIVYLTINETGTPERIELTKIGGSNTTYQADWRISSNHLDQPFFYAGIEIYDYETLSTEDSTNIEFRFTGLLYSIAGD
jgi:hypothetical protein